MNQQETEKDLLLDWAPPIRRKIKAHEATYVISSSYISTKYV